MRPIDADAVLDILRNFDHEHADLENGSEDFVYGVETAIEVIEDAPTLEERKKGKWRYYDGMCSCSVCKSHMDDISPFCPMCGADMRG